MGPQGLRAYGALLLLCAVMGAPGDDALTLYRKGSTAFIEKRYDDAIAALSGSLAVEPRQLPVLRLLGLTYQLAGQLENAGTRFREACRLAPRDAESWFYLGRLEYVRNYFDQALTALQTAAGYAPADSRIRETLGLTFEALGDPASAEREYKAALGSIGSHPATPYLNYGALLLKLGRVRESEPLLLGAVERMPDSWQAHFELAKLYRETGRAGKALTELETALARAPGADETARTRALISSLRPDSGPRDTGVSGSTAASAPPVRFTELAARAGLTFVLRNHATAEKHQVEAMPAGVAVLDFDNDGFEDLYFVNGAAVPGLDKTGPADWNRLYRNNGDGTFTDVSERAGVTGAGYGMAVAAADYDNDGFPDLFVAGVNRNILYHNRGDGTFEDVTAHAGLDRRGPSKPWSISAGWFDYDNDGRLDLFVSNYCKWDAATEPCCGDSRPGYRTYCHPKHYEGLACQLYRNNGDGTFTDVSVASGIAGHTGKGMGVAFADYDGDGRMDVFVANDTVPNFLFHNEGNGTFRENAVPAGTAFNADGRATSGMGADFRDIDNDGRPDLFVTALPNETFSLYRNAGGGAFRDSTYASGLALLTLPWGGWSTGIYDLNNDGWKDLFVAASDVMDNAELFSSRTWRQPNRVYVNLGGGKFSEAAAAGGMRPHRGCAFGDFDNDGRIDVVVTSHNDAVEFLHNVSDPGQHWLDLLLEGTRSNRDGIGASVRLTTPSGLSQLNHATTSVGYASSSSRRIHFGLGKEQRAGRIEIQWPSGERQVITNVPADRLLKIREGAPWPPSAVPGPRPGK